MKSTTTLAMGLVAVLAAVAGYYLGTSGSEEASKKASTQTEEEIAYWVAPMDPNYRRDAPGKSPMGMDLIPVYENDADDEASVKISPETLNNIGARLGTASRQTISREIRTVGYVGYDETKVSHVHMRAEGWIDELVAKVEGERISKGELLFRIYSPEIVVAQSEYLQALRDGRKEQIALADERLQLLGLEPRQVEALAKSRQVKQLIEIYAAQDGVIADLNIAEKMFVTPGTSILTIADLSTVWVLADIFESQMDFAHKGLKAMVMDGHGHGVHLEGVVDYAYPLVDPKTRTTKIRLRFENAKEILKPNMFVDVTLFGEAVQNALVIPKDSLIQTGASTRVVVSLGEGRFTVREVKTGIETSDVVEILHGLDEGVEVVVAGQFLIDSEASLSSSFRRMEEATPATPKAPPHKMEGKVEEETEAVIHSLGTVHHVMPQERKINLTHEPIPEIGWPAMTMDFDVAEGVDMDHLAKDDKIHFEIRKGLDGIYLITAIHKMTHGGMGAE